jgi:hypothetical protein
VFPHECYLFRLNQLKVLDNSNWDWSGTMGNLLGHETENGFWYLLWLTLYNLVIFWDRVSLCSSFVLVLSLYSPGWPPSLISQVLRLQACTIIPSMLIFLSLNFYMCRKNVEFDLSINILTNDYFILTTKFTHSEGKART